MVSVVLCYKKGKEEEEEEEEEEEGSGRGAVVGRRRWLDVEV